MTSKRKCEDEDYPAAKRARVVVFEETVESLGKSTSSAHSNLLLMIRMMMSWS
jgi:hypothetical protein